MASASSRRGVENLDIQSKMQIWLFDPMVGKFVARIVAIYIFVRVLTKLVGN